jgi:hypothetical protein
LLFCILLTDNPTNHRFSRVERQTKTSQLRENNPVYFKPVLTEKTLSCSEIILMKIEMDYIVTVGNFTIVRKWLWRPKSFEILI